MTRDGVIAGSIIPGLIGLMMALDTDISDPWRVVGLGILLISVLVALYGAFVGVTLVSVLLRGFAVLLPVLGVIGIAVAAIVLTETLDTPLKQALLAGSVVVSGWVVTFLIQESRLAEDKRSTRIDVLLSLDAEIDNFIKKQEEIPFASRKTALEEAEKEAEADEDFKPFFYTEVHPLIFPTVASRLPYLDKTTVFSLVRFYAQVEDIIQMSADMNSPLFLSRPKENRLTSYLRNIELRERAQSLAHDALSDIRKELGLLGYRERSPL